MGFAVVADQVRNLAQRSAEAAKDTSTLIQEAIDRTATGQETVGRCAGGTTQQVRGVETIAKAVGQIKQVTQTTAANVEESASAGQEIAAQAQTFQALVTDLEGLVQGSTKA